jgi:hypothetical protein
MATRVAATKPMSYGLPGLERDVDVGEVFELAGCLHDQLLVEKGYLHVLPKDLPTVRCPLCAAEFIHDFEVAQHQAKRHGGGEAA